MFTSFSEFKFFQSFRIPVESSDDVRFLIEYEAFLMFTILKKSTVCIHNMICHYYIFI